MAAENRLTTEQLAALAPGDRVTIESGSDFGRRRYTTGTVLRITTSCIVVRIGRYLEEYRLRDGIRTGGGGRAELVDLEGQAAASEARRRTSHIDVLYREWARDRTDVDRLRRLHEAIGACLDAELTGP